MVYEILLQPESNKVRATVLNWPECTAEGETEEAALQRIREVIRERLATSKIVQVDVTPPTAPHPWQQYAGMWRDDPAFEEFLTKLTTYRKQVEITT